MGARSSFGHCLVVSLTLNDRDFETDKCVQRRKHKKYKILQIESQNMSKCVGQLKFILLLVTTMVPDDLQSLVKW